MSQRSPAVEVFDAESSLLLATGQEEGEADGHRLTFSCSKGNGTLLAYYFGKGKREVRVRAGRNEGLTGQLSTRWRSGHREWILD
jgi:hypothetical protein